MNINSQNGQIMTTPNFLPDGPWTGFYEEYGKEGNFPMSCTFTFSEGNISGSGSDEVGTFTFAGSYSKDYQVSMKKSYHTHTLLYEGHADENGIWGKWSFPAMKFISAGFHLWPKKGAKESIKEELAIEEAIEELLEVEETIPLSV